MLFLMLLWWGCASAPDIVSKETKEGDAYSADEVRRVTVDQPFLLSGDYFREKKQEKRIDLGNLLSKNESESKDSGVEELSNSKIQAQASNPPIPQASNPIPQASNPPIPQASNPIPQASNPSIPNPSNPQPFPPKVGFILDPESMTRETAKAILLATPQVAKAFPVIVADQDQIMETLTSTDCLEKRDLLCVSRAVGVYPGVRMLALIERFEIPKQMPGTVRTRIEVVDTGLSVRYPLIEITAQLRNKAEVNTFISQVLRNLFDFAVKKSGIMPWFCRSFSREKQSWYISAGKMSGLKPGDALRVVSGGKLVKTPAGLPAGWIPGKQKGTLKVDLLFGRDFASCSLTEGEGPDSDDMLLTP